MEFIYEYSIVAFALFLIAGQIAWRNQMKFSGFLLTGGSVPMVILWTIALLFPEASEFNKTYVIDFSYGIDITNLVDVCYFLEPIFFTTNGLATAVLALSITHRSANLQNQRFRKNIASNVDTKLNDSNSVVLNGKRISAKP